MGWAVSRPLITKIQDASHVFPSDNMCSIRLTQMRLRGQAICLPDHKTFSCKYDWHRGIFDHLILPLRSSPIVERHHNDVDWYEVSPILPTLLKQFFPTCFSFGWLHVSKIPTVQRKTWLWRKTAIRDDWGLVSVFILGPEIWMSRWTMTWGYWGKLHPNDTKLRTCFDQLRHKQMVQARVEGEPFSSTKHNWISVPMGFQ